MASITFYHALNHWLHLLALALWIGEMAFFLFVFGPTVHTLPPGLGVQALDRGRRSLEKLSWIAIGFLIVTGALSLAFGAVTTRAWSGPGYLSLLSVKLLLFLAMLFHHSLQAFKYSPRIVLLTAQTGEEIASWPEPLLSYWKKWFVLLKINAVLGMVILLLAVNLRKV